MFKIRYDVTIHFIFQLILLATFSSPALAASLEASCESTVDSSLEFNESVFLGLPVFLTEKEQAALSLLPAAGESVAIYKLAPYSTRNKGIFRALYSNAHGRLVRTRIVKNYGTNRRRAIEEVEKMESLSQWIKNSPATEERFHVATYRILSESTISTDTIVEVQNIWGRTVDSVLNDPQLPTKTKDLVMSLYQQRQQHYVLSLTGQGAFKRNADSPKFSSLIQAEAVDYFESKANNPFAKLWVYMKPRGFSYNRTFDVTEAGYFLLKPDQVIVNLNTLEMTIIDPF